MIIPKEVVTWVVRLPHRPGLLMRQDTVSIIRQSFYLGDSDSAKHTAAGRSSPKIDPNVVRAPELHSVSPPSSTVDDPVSSIPSTSAKTTGENYHSFGPYFRGVNGTTDRVVWFTSKGDHAIRSPEVYSDDDLQDGFLHVHQYGGFGDTQVWIWLKGTWESVLEGYPHPNISGYVFSMRGINEPAWIKKKSPPDINGQLKGT